MKYNYYADLPEHLKKLADSAQSSLSLSNEDDLIYYDVFNFGPKFLVDKSYALDKKSLIIYDNNTDTYWYISTERSHYLKRNLNLVVAEFLECYYTDPSFGLNIGTDWWADKVLDLLAEVIFSEKQFSNAANEYFKAVELESYDNKKIIDFVNLVAASQTYEEYIRNIISLWHYFHINTEDMKKVFIKALEFAVCDSKWQGLLYDCTNHYIFNYKNTYNRNGYTYVEYELEVYH